VFFLSLFRPGPDLCASAARAAEARRAFEADAEARLSEHVLNAPSADAFYAFAPAERAWRDVAHEVAAALGLFSETVEDEEGLKFVAVHKERLVVAVPEVERAGAAARARARQGTLSDAAPAMSADLVKLNVVKRDLRGVTAVLEEMGKKTKTGEK